MAEGNPFTFREAVLTSLLVHSLLFIYVLLFPEGMVKLQGGAGEIMKRIDGTTTLAQLITALQAAFPGADLRQDVLDFVSVAQGKGWIKAQLPS